MEKRKLANEILEIVDNSIIIDEFDTIKIAFTDFDIDVKKEIRSYYNGLTRIDIIDYHAEDIEDIEELETVEIIEILTEKEYKKLTNQYYRIKEKIEDILTQFDYAELLNNFYSNGVAWYSYMQAIVDGDIEEQERLEQAINTSNYRHRNTDYDLIDKTKMTEEQVNQLRREYNR